MRALISLIILLVSFAVSASNRYYSDNRLEPQQGFNWDWSVGLGYYVEDSYLIGLDSYDDGLEPNINLVLSYDKFYLDVDNSQLSGGMVIGYSLIDKYDWGLDILGTNVQSGFDETGLKLYDRDVIDALAGIDRRHYDFDMGIRLSRRFESSQLSFELLHDVTDTHNDWVFTTFLSSIQQYRNWEFRGGLGFNVYGREFSDYYFGIDEHESTETRPYYKPDIAYAVMLELHAEHPLSQNWVFLAGWLSTYFSGEISDSPIISQSYQHKAKVGVRYVF
ncbi:MipA/OmpV family protein [Pseudoalteromonas ruthenica]|uniref:Membrane protein n=1 Tax=Pseudoalteromonas ruthenica TaxID=151081 RepID=A0A0F4Q1A3_9GAMM|nr:MipA/OmpV family protein [Pseudoalteromonas ruthenica]KJZ00812.1 membrane protein [Pseudoalteromonas ruthenica]KJZ01135.1 membrane protein [Pseudoalteromonas ruthenica]TMO85701.1 MipA/OmpV family protein [Pseudoalteromonas ruthenica]TMO92470.1 MipA/OmpV family protein [Pseudoalteromonas ruthenica]TMO98940.1 MipA/OmpV family protein [Pseudoalteromonas ruthenica]